MNEKPLKVIAGAPDSPLEIGDIKIPCYVLEGEIRVLSDRGLTAGIGLNPEAGFRVRQFLGTKALRPFVNNDIMPALKDPYLFPNPTGGGNAYGFGAEVLEYAIDAILDCERAGVLPPRHADIAQRAYILNQGLRRIGIIGLIDEATGYQRIRSERALATILERFIAKQLQPWTKTFPYEFYEQIFRLRGWPGPHGAKRPKVIGHYTNDFVYARMAPGVLDELQRVTPRLPTGQLKHRYFQRFTPDIGHPKLKEHLAAVTALMRAAPNWNAFTRSIERAFPKLNENVPLPFDTDC